MVEDDPKTISDPITDIVPRGLTTERSDVRVFHGYYNFEANTWRLYRTLDLDEYLEGHENDLVHVVHLRSEKHPLAGTVIWVKATASIERSVRIQLDSPEMYRDITFTSWCPRPPKLVAGEEPPREVEGKARRLYKKIPPGGHTTWC